METFKWPTCQGAHNYRVFVGELPSRNRQLGKPQSRHVSCVCRGLWWDSAWTLSRHLWVRGLARLRLQGARGVCALAGPARASSALTLLASWRSGDCLMCQLGSMKLCSELILGLCHGIPDILSWGYATVFLVSHLCMASTILRLSADTVVIKGCLCLSMSQVSFSHFWLSAF